MVDGAGGFGLAWRVARDVVPDEDEVPDEESELESEPGPGSGGWGDVRSGSDGWGQPAGGWGR